ncbi:hypothetical protein PPACK8108_LOCUS16262 [Phakopsora pachyrhizi]|uniref:Uncharacterized protein n=1 Tax=Phakopsora pachyrhizi TaxID=170000 RepID=A0AAV0B7U4_PHAPC|nr:hypothetical protein PPACK8108_LOCUS16262 [Phakopsora pachyrhizi]
MPVKKDQHKKGRNRQNGDVDIAGPTTYCKADDISQGRRRKALCGDTIAGPTKARIRFGEIKIVRRIRKPWEGKRPV